MNSFNLRLIRQRANYPISMRDSFPRIHIEPTTSANVRLVYKWVSILTKTAHNQGIQLDIFGGELMALDAIKARANGMTYLESAITAINEWRK